MIRLSIPLRQALSRLSLPVLIALAFGTMLLGKADALLAERARMALADALAPIWASLQQPVASVRGVVQEAGLLLDLQAENARLHEENERLRRWQATALALEAENAVLQRQLHFVPEVAPAFQTVVFGSGKSKKRASGPLDTAPAGHGIGFGGKDPS